MEGYCKGCLVRYDDPSLLIQYTEKNRRLYVYSTGIQVKRNDLFLPFQLCKECYLNMKQSCKFKKQCRTSDKSIKNYLTLKDTGDVTDFSTYLRNNDDSFMIKFPMVNGTTPSKRARDDDNVSTCTSIRNFMSDILQADEIPDTEARIIKEVIEEEADILEDSLDSHWLQDDVSIDTDFRLDFSFSPFSTPRPRHESFQTPTQGETFQIPQKENHGKDKIIDKESFIAAKKILLRSVGNSDKLHDNDNLNIGTVTDKIEEAVSQNIERLECQNTLTSYRELVNEGHQIEISNSPNKKDHINFNLEKALKNAVNTEFSLEDILATPESDAVLATPPIQPGGSGLSSPTLQNIIYGEKLEPIKENGHFESNDQKPSSEAGVDILEDFFNKETGEYIGDVNKNEEKEIFEEYTLEKPGKSQYDMSDFSCKLCNKRYKHVRALKIHFTKIHKIKLPSGRMPESVQEVICDHCGKSYNRLSNLRHHIKRKHFNGGYKCKKCSLEYGSRVSLKRHMVTHNTAKQKKSQAKNYVCTICGYATALNSNWHMHMRRHTKEYLFKCSECGRGFYTKFDHEAHMRSHTKERPFPCPQCHKRFSRRDTLNSHMKGHTGERLFACEYCNATYVKKTHLREHIMKSKRCLEIRDRAPSEPCKDKKKYATLKTCNDCNGEKYVVEKTVSESNKSLSPITADIEMTDLLDMGSQADGFECESVDLPDIGDSDTDIVDTSNIVNDTMESNNMEVDPLLSIS